MQKVYIGRVDQDGHVFMLAADRKTLMPHITGGYPFNVEPVFQSYNVEDLNLAGLERHGLRPLTKTEAVAFMAGKDIHGNIVKSPREAWSCVA